jgi:hypothetical protein
MTSEEEEQIAAWWNSVWDELWPEAKADISEIYATFKDAKRMNEEKAREILGDAINDDNSLCTTYGRSGPKQTALGYVAWSPGDEDITLDSQFTVEEVEAIAWWMRNKNGPRKDAHSRNSLVRRTYRNCSKEPYPGDLVMWNGHPTRVGSVGPESAMIINCKFGENLHLNVPEQIDLIEAYDGTKP